MGRYTPLEGIEGFIQDLNNPEFKKRSIKTSLITGILCGITFLVTTLGLNYISKYEFVPKDSVVRTEMVDRDLFADLVMPGGRILLADQTDKGIVYRPLESSDIYRIR